jgi:hypothetical protein
MRLRAWKRTDASRSLADALASARLPNELAHDVIEDVSVERARELVDQVYPLLEDDDGNQAELWSNFLASAGAEPAALVRALLSLPSSCSSRSMWNSRADDVTKSTKHLNGRFFTAFWRGAATTPRTASRER